MLHRLCCLREKHTVLIISVYIITKIHLKRQELRVALLFPNFLTNIEVLDSPRTIYGSVASLLSRTFLGQFQ